ncbi:MAG: hypothetical protein ACI92C_000595 [Neolewinella sp.]|jgi:hypothetical protein
MKKFTLYLILPLFLAACGTKTPQTDQIQAKPSASPVVLAEGIALIEGKDGTKLQVNGKDFMINGMNWDYFPIGTNYEYILWEQPEALIRAALEDEMTLLKNMGVNTVRMYTGVPAKWITYIYETHGIYTMLNHSFGRYGLTIDGNWVANTEYADARTREILLAEVVELAKDYQNTPGLLLYLLGNENNYGLSWEGAETEDIPVEDTKTTEQARALYRLMNEAVVKMKTVDQAYPIAICNGDLAYLDLIVEECPDVDILGTNMYRGLSFGDAFKRVKKAYGKPLLFTEFGTDAFDAVNKKEDQQSQAGVMVSNWKEIYANAAGLSGAGNSIGGFTFQFSDGWWKFGQTLNLNVHDDNASWGAGGYESDFKKGENNMNEEWFGICAKGPTNERGLYKLSPRAAYYALKEAHRFDPFATGANRKGLDTHFTKINLVDAATRARKDRADR